MQYEYRYYYAFTIIMVVIATAYWYDWQVLIARKQSVVREKIVTVTRVKKTKKREKLTDVDRLSQVLLAMALPWQDVKVTTSSKGLGISFKGKNNEFDRYAAFLRFLQKNVQIKRFSLVLLKKGYFQLTVRFLQKNADFLKNTKKATQIQPLEHVLCQSLEPRVVLFASNEYAFQAAELLGVLAAGERNQALVIWPNGSSQWLVKNSVIGAQGARIAAIKQASILLDNGSSIELMRQK